MRSERRDIEGPRASTSTATGGERQSQIAFSRDGRFLALALLGPANGTTPLRLVEVATGRVLWSATAPRPIFAGGGSHLAFTPDRKALVTAGGLTEAFVWRLEPPAWRASPPARPEAADLVRAWEALAGDDAEKADEAGWLLATHAEQGVPFLKVRLPAAAAPAPGRVRRLLADLDSEEFAAREAALRELKALDGGADAAVRAALAAKPGLETARRLDEVLAGGGPAGVTGEPLRRLRAVAALERAATAEARALLAELAGGAETRMTREARAAAARLGAARGG